MKIVFGELLLGGSLSEEFLCLGGGIVLRRELGFYEKGYKINIDVDAIIM